MGLAFLVLYSKFHFFSYRSSFLVLDGWVVWPGGTMDQPRWRRIHNEKLEPLRSHEQRVQIRDVLVHEGRRGGGGDLADPPPPFVVACNCCRCWIQVFVPASATHRGRNRCPGWVDELGSNESFEFWYTRFRVPDPPPPLIPPPVQRAYVKGYVLDAVASLAFASPRPFRACNVLLKPPRLSFLHCSTPMHTLP